MIAVESLPDDRRCYDVDGTPACDPVGVDSHEAVLVDRLADVTCPLCNAVLLIGEA